MSSTVACNSPGSFSLPAAAVPVTVKMPEPMTMPTPKNARAQGPSDFFKRWDGSSDDWMSSSIDLVRVSDMEKGRAWGRFPTCLPLALALDHLLDLAFHRSARHIRGPLAQRSGFLARRAFQLLAFGSVFDVC